MSRTRAHRSLERRGSAGTGGLPDDLYDYAKRSMPVPGDPDQVIYVWFDALGNYITALGYGSDVPTPPAGFAESDRLLQTATRLPDTVAVHLHAYAFDRALLEVWAFVAEANRYVTEEAPWELAKAAASPDQETVVAGDAALRGALFSLSVSLLTIAQCIAPLLPETSRKLSEKFGEGRQHFSLQALSGLSVEAGQPLFPKP